ncbi:MAG: hypothetical protein ACR2NR_18600 [Solirubrobacteraceae bacterium]
MSDLLAIFGPTDSDSELLTEIERMRPTRVTVLIEGVDSDWANDDTATASALRDRLAALMALIERRTGATVVGAAGDRDQLLGWRFDRELSSRVPVAA